MAESRAGVAERRAGKYLTFQLGKETYGIEILKVQEIIRVLPVTCVPRLPDFVRGVVNLRGKVIPIVDLRRKFDLPKVEDTARSCIIVVQVRWTGQLVTMGVLVDQVAEVVAIAESQVEETPNFGAEVRLDFIPAMGKLADRVIMLLDVDRVMTAGEMETLNLGKENA